MNTNEFGKWLRSQLKAKGLKQTEFADLSGLSKGAISSVVNGQQQPGFDFCDKAARALQLPTVYVLQLAGLIESEGQEQAIEDNPRVRELIQLAKGLPEKKLRLLLGFAQLLADDD